MSEVDTWCTSSITCDAGELNARHLAPWPTSVLGLKSERGSSDDIRLVARGGAAIDSDSRLSAASPLCAHLMQLALIAGRRP